MPKEGGQEGQLLPLPFSKGGRGGKECPAQFYKFFSTINQNKAQIVFEWTFEWTETIFLLKTAHLQIREIWD